MFVNKYIASGLLIIGLSFTVFATWQITEAAHPGAKNPLGLYDANGTFLGNVVGFSYGIFDGGYKQLYSTYLPSVDGVFQFSFNGSGIALPQTQITFYPLPDCQGQAYIVPGHYSLLAPMIVQSSENGNIYRISTTTEEVDSLSRYAGGCTSDNTGTPMNKLIPVTLPFNFSSVTLPFSIQ